MLFRSKEEYPRSIGKRLLTTTDGGKHRDLGVSVGTRSERTDVVLVGGGIMSATLGVFLKELEPSWNIILLERLDKVAQESTNPWNNAGTGHSALCELNYAPAGPDGTVNPAKALDINEQFQVSRQFWASLAVDRKSVV